jgi:hypothetical protein
LETAFKHGAAAVFWYLRRSRHVTSGKTTHGRT